MRGAERIGQLLLGVACALFSTAASAQEPCRIAFDIGSSGIRAGASNSEAVSRTNIDYLASLRTGRGLEEAIAPTIAALDALPRQGQFAAACARVGGGFSAWRLALQQDAGKLVSNLASIKAATGVAVLVIPQNVEGGYGFFGARQLLGSRLTTSHILDIGGGSLQIAGERSSFGEMLGQKIWHQRLCLAIRNTTVQPCALQPMTMEELAKARSRLAKQLTGVSAALPEKVSMTAISRPVTQGVAPAVERLLDKPSGQKSVSRSDITTAIDRLAKLSLNEIAVRLGVPSKYAAYLLSDMLLVEGLMQATGGNDLRIAEIDLTNLPGLLADDIAFRWVGSYGCYLERLGRSGLEAYSSDPTTCPPSDHPPEAKQ
jgi:hypothetical protein